jgi:glycosyltransferase involved in cell wall biosynthesis
LRNLITHGSPIDKTMLVILTTHPIQYQVPIWQQLARENRIDFEVWYLTDHGTKTSYDVQFGKSFSWDINTLEGYPYRFLKTNKGAAPNKGFKNLRLKDSLVPLLKERNVTSMLVNGWQVLAYWQAVWQAHRAGVKIWLRAETNDIKPVSWKEPVRKVLLNQFFKRIDYYLYIGKANKRFYKNYGIREEQLKVGHYCIDNDRFVQQASRYRPEKLDIRKQWGIADEAICFLFSGKFIAKKRPLDIINAARLYKGKKPIHLLFIGSGELNSELKRACTVIYDEGRLNPIAQNNEKPAASFVGFLNQNEITKAYVAADCLILPSNFGETWGLVVNEALVCGIPAIVSNQVGCAEDLIKPLDPRLVFKCGDNTALTEAIEHITEYPLPASRIFDQADHYHLRHTVDTITKLYNNTR